MARELPNSIALPLRRFVARSRRRAVLRAAGIAIAFVLVCGLGACLVDRVLPLPSWVRFAILVIGIVTPAAILAGPAAHMIFRRIDWLAAAEAAEASRPSLNQRLQTVVSEYLEPPQRRASQQIVEQLAADVQAELTTPLRPAVSAWRIATPWLIAAGVLALGAALLPQPRLGLRPLSMRLLQPFHDYPPVTTTQVRIDPGDIALPAGSRLDIRVRTARLGDGAVELYLSPDRQRWTAHSMTPSGEHDFVHSLPSVDRDLWYQVRAGDARTRAYRATVLRRPQVLEYHATLEYPPYLNLPSRTLDLSDPAFELPAGTRLTLQFACTEPLQSATLSGAGVRIAMSPASDARQWQAQLRVVRDMELALDLVSAGQQSARAPAPVLIRAIPDRPPIVRLLDPPLDLRLGSKDHLPIAWRATDDNALRGLWLLLQSGGKPLRELPLPIHGDPRRQEGSITLDLGALDLQLGDSITLSVVAADGADRPVKAASETRHILIAPCPVPASTGARIAELRRAARAADQLSADLAAARDAYQNIRRSGDVPEAQRIAQVVRVNQALASAADRASLLQHSLLRSIVRSERAERGAALASWLDQACVRARAIERLNAAISDDRADERQTTDAFARMVLESQQLQQAIQRCAEGEHARALLLELQNLRTLAGRPSEGMRIAQKQFDAAIDSLKLNQQPPEPALRGKVEAGLNSEHPAPVDFASLAQQWSDALQGGREAPNLPERLALAAAAEAAAAEAAAPAGNPEAARDLALAASAAAILEQPATADSAAIERYPAALATLRSLHQNRQPPTDLVAQSREARDLLRKWAGRPEDPLSLESPEDLALEANLAASQGRFDLALSLDARIRQRNAPATQRATSMADPRPAMQLAQRIDSLLRPYATSMPTTRPVALADALDALVQSERSRENILPASQPSQTAPLAALRQAAADVASLPSRLDEFSRHGQAYRELLARSQQRFTNQAELTQVRGAAKETGQKLSAAADTLNIRLDELLRRLNVSVGTDAADLTLLAQDKLLPAAVACIQATRSGDRPAADRALGTVRDIAIQLCRLAPDAQRRLAASDPLAAAAWLARNGQGADDYALMIAALRQSRDRAIGDAAVHRQHLIPILAAALHEESRPLWLPIARTAKPSRRPSNVPQLNSSITDPQTRDPDFAIYQDALRAYFDAINKAQPELLREGDRR